MKAKLQEIASRFALAAPIASIDSLGEGFINDTFIVRTEGEAPDYILQRKNKNIFPDVPAMMENISKVTEHIRRGVIAAGGDPMSPRPTGRSTTSTPTANTGPYRSSSPTPSPTTRPTPRRWPARAARASASSRPSWPTSPNRSPRRSRASTTSATASCSGTRPWPATPQAA